MTTIQTTKPEARASTAQEKYNERQERVGQQLHEITVLIRNHRRNGGSPARWNAVGDLGYVTEQLDEVIGFLKSAER